MTANEMREPTINAGERLSLYVAALAAGAVFSILFEGGDPSNASIFGSGVLAPLLGAALLAILVGSAGKFRFALLVPSAVVYSLVAVYGAPPLTLSGWRRFLPEIGGDLYQAANTMYIQPVPYEPAPGLLVFFIPMVMVICAFATSATLYERTPVVSVATLGLTVGVISTISFENGAGPFFFVFVVAALLLMLSTGAAPESASLTRVGLAAGAVVALVVLLSPKAPLADEIISPGAIDWTRIGTGGTSRLDVQADVGEYLTTGREVELMRVSSTQPLLWRGGTLDNFDGVTWNSTAQPGYGDGVEVASSVPTSTVVQSYDILESETDVLFGGYRISGVSSDIAEKVTRNEDGSWNTEEPLTEGDGYRLISEVPQPTSGQLQNAGTDYPQEVDERFLQLPENTPEAVATTADEVEANYDTSNPYATARAVERYLSTDGGFTYNLDVSYRRADWAIEEFLGGDKEGFCTQFATSMALILRDMDVPTRVVYGATTGETVEDNVYVVKGENMHTWVEVYFPGVGWYPFDPTPGFTMPQTMQANAPRPVETAVPDTPTSENRALRDDQAERLEQPAEETPERQPSQNSGAGDDPGVASWLAPILLAASLVGAIPLAKCILLARGRPEDLYRDLLGRLTDVSPGRGAGIANAGSLTVNERLTFLAGACGLSEDPFLEFGMRYSSHLYGPVVERPAKTSRELTRAHRRAVAEFGELPVWRRFVGAVNPASLLVRAGRSVKKTFAGVAKVVCSRLGR